MPSQVPTTPLDPTSDVTTAGRNLVLVVAFLGWFFAGVHMSITTLAMRAASIQLMDADGTLDRRTFTQINSQAADGERALSATEKATLTTYNTLAAQWFAWHQCAFLFGAATGGIVFGWLGDRLGRSKAMAASILCYSVLSGVAYFCQDPVQFLVLRFLACLGIGGMWPNGVALVSEVWSSLSRPFVAGVIGTAANIGIFLMATLAAYIKITPDSWRWTMLVGAAPAVLGVFSWLVVPESPRWLAARRMRGPTPDRKPPTGEIFRPPLLGITLVGIALATVPLIGGWGSANWMLPWADEAGEAANPPDPYLKARVGQARALTGIVGSLLGGWIASVVGRRRSYFLTSLAALGIAQYAFWFTVPTDDTFLLWVAALGFFSGIYFGWLPLFLPELFPTRVRSTGSGVSFNFGRILTAVTVFMTGALEQFFQGDYARMGRYTSTIFAVGMLVILLAPGTSEQRLED